MQHRKASLDWDPGDNASFLIGRAARLFTRRADERLREIGFGAAHMPVLRALRNGDAKSQTELAALARIEQPTMAQMLARMERDGVVERSPNPDDGRSSLYKLTRPALARVASARGVVVQGSEEMLAGLSATEIAQLTALLKRMIANLEEV